MRIDEIAQGYQKYEEIWSYVKKKDKKVVLNHNTPYYNEHVIGACEMFRGYEYYAAKDELGRCTGAFAVLGTETLPKHKRKGISGIKPTGWINTQYDWIPGKYCYNRCHLIGFQLSGQNANSRNLITGTKQLNVDSDKGMLIYENIVKEYICATGNHVVYRVVPRFYKNNLLADGITLEALSLEDYGKGVSFYVFIPNSQKGLIIDYKDGSTYV